MNSLLAKLLFVCLRGQMNVMPTMAMGKKTRFKPNIVTQVPRLCALTLEMRLHIHPLYLRELR